MSIIPFGKTRRELQAMRGELKDLRETNQLQALIIDDYSVAQKASTTAYVGNSYREYMKTIAEIAKKYDAEAEWGVLQTGNIVDVRAAFIIGQGVTVLPSDEVAAGAASLKGAARRKALRDTEEMKFIRDFFAYNNLDREMAQEFAKEAEIEGCFLGHLFWDEKNQQVSIQFRSRVDKNYTVHHVANDYSWYDQVTWKDGSAEVTLEEPNFVYARFGGRIHLPNKPIPKIGKCLSQIEAMDKALRDWREINHLYATPIPTIECANAQDAKAMDAATANINWKLRKRVVIAGHFVYVTPDLTGSNEALEKEITANAKMVSGTTGVPVHFLGLPDLMSNRATADNLMELVSASTSKERQIWTGAYSEIIEKAMAIYNANSKMTPLQADRYKVIIPFVTEAAWARIIDLYLPSYIQGAISLETFLAQIPGVDVDAELERKEERDAKALEKFSKQAEDEEEDADTEDEERP